jgi:translation initiation factor IF-3
MKKEVEVKINRQIKSVEVRLVGDNVENGIYLLDTALSMSRELGLDLIEINPNVNPPICKIMDIKKHIYDIKKKQKDMEKKNRLSRVETKELRFGPNTDEHDFNFKKNHAISFLKDGDKVKATVSFKGREINFKDSGEIILLRLADEVSEVGIVEQLPKLEGNKMIIVIRPKK